MKRTVLGVIALLAVPVGVRAQDAQSQFSQRAT